MPFDAFATRRSQPAPFAAFDFGLRVRVAATDNQRSLFSGAEDLSLHELTSEFSLMVSELRIRSFSLRAELECVTCALLSNVRCGFWFQARRAAVDLGNLLAWARKRRLADAELCVRGANCAFHIADRCAKEVR